MKKIAVLGAGLMGAGIAQVAAAAGYEVILRDLQITLVNDGLKAIGQSLNKMVNNNQISQAMKEATMARIKGTTDLAQVRNSDLVIEAIVENIAIKKQIFTELDHLCPENTILATNTSTLSITEIAFTTRRPDKVLGMHFFFPVASVKIVELIKGLGTSDETIRIARNFANRINKNSIVVLRDSPGFVVNRILVAYINEAINVLGEGIAGVQEIDKAMKLGAGLQYGPLEMADIIGLDSLYNMLQTLYNEYKDSRFRPHIIFSNMIRAGYLGKKSGKGFYDYI
ncbi:MAG: 3-hydroxyacyl-CoA dehydrogenase family protein [Syntrophomonadaceae bacterium]